MIIQYLITIATSSIIFLEQKVFFITNQLEVNHPRYFVTTVILTLPLAFAYVSITGCPCSEEHNKCSVNEFCGNKDAKCAYRCSISPEFCKFIVKNNIATSQETLKNLVHNSQMLMADEVSVMFNKSEITRKTPKLNNGIINSKIRNTHVPVVYKSDSTYKLNNYCRCYYDGNMTWDYCKINNHTRCPKGCKLCRVDNNIRHSSSVVDLLLFNFGMKYSCIACKPSYYLHYNSQNIGQCIPYTSARNHCHVSCKTCRSDCCKFQIDNCLTCHMHQTARPIYTDGTGYCEPLILYNVTNHEVATINPLSDTNLHGKITSDLSKFEMICNKNIPMLKSDVQTKSWTQLVFIHADNNLENGAIYDLKEMLEPYDLDAADDLHLVVLIDRRKGGDNSPIEHINLCPTSELTDYTVHVNSRFHTAYELYRIRVNKWRYEWLLLRDCGELDMGDPNVLANFITRALNIFPANLLSLTLWNHGSAWAGFGSDESHPYSVGMSLLDMEQGIRNGLHHSKLWKKNKKLKFAILGFDACLMSSYSVVKQFTELAHYILGSEDNEPGYGWNWRYLKPSVKSSNVSYNNINTVRSRRATSAYEYANALIMGYSEYASYNSLTLSLIEIAIFKKFDRLFVKFLKTLYACGGSRINTYIRRAASASPKVAGCQMIGLCSCIDFGNLLSRLLSEITNLRQDVTPIIRQALELRRLYDEMVVLNLDNLRDTMGKVRMTGLSTYFPDNNFLKGSCEEKNVARIWQINFTRHIINAWSKFIKRIRNNEEGRMCYFHGHDNILQLSGLNIYRPNKNSFSIYETRFFHHDNRYFASGLVPSNVVHSISFRGLLDGNKQLLHDSVLFVLSRRSTTLTKVDIKKGKKVEELSIISMWTGDIWIGHPRGGAYTINETSLELNNQSVILSAMEEYSQNLIPSADQVEQIIFSFDYYANIEELAKNRYSRAHLVVMHSDSRDIITKELYLQHDGVNTAWPESIGGILRPRQMWLSLSKINPDLSQETTLEENYLRWLPSTSLYSWGSDNTFPILEITKINLFNNISHQRNRIIDGLDRALMVLYARGPRNEFDYFAASIPLYGNTSANCDKWADDGICDKLCIKSSELEDCHYSTAAIATSDNNVDNDSILMEACINNECDPNAICIPNSEKIATSNVTQLGYTCKCLEGYDGDGKVCVDRDECSSYHDCHENAECINLPGRYVCFCKNGYYGDGISLCLHMRECDPRANSTRQCQDGLHCIADDESYVCGCRQGYTLNPDKKSCADIDECKLGIASCSTNSDCINVVGGYFCSCKKKYSGDGRVCVRGQARIRVVMLIGVNYYDILSKMCFEKIKLTNVSKKLDNITVDSRIAKRPEHLNNFTYNINSDIPNLNQLTAISKFDDNIAVRNLQCDEIKAKNILSSIIIQALSKALAISDTRIDVIEIHKGSIYVEFLILPPISKFSFWSILTSKDNMLYTDEPSAEEAFFDLKNQLKDTSSLLFQDQIFGEFALFSVIESYKIEVHYQSLFWQVKLLMIKIIMQIKIFFRTLLQYDKTRFFLIIILIACTTFILVECCCSTCFRKRCNPRTTIDSVDDQLFQHY